VGEREQFEARFREIQPKFSRLYGHLLAEANLTLPQFTLLAQLIGRRTMSMTEVSSHLHVSKPAVTNLVDRLEENGYLKRLAHPEDRRVFLLEVEAKGERVVRSMQARGLELLLKVFDQFNTKEQKVISSFYQLLSEKMDEMLMQLPKKATL